MLGGDRRRGDVRGDKRVCQGGVSGGMCFFKGCVMGYDSYIPWLEMPCATEGM